MVYGIMLSYNYRGARPNLNCAAGERLHGHGVASVASDANQATINKRNSLHKIQVGTRKHNPPANISSPNPPVNINMKHISSSEPHVRASCAPARRARAVEWWQGDPSRL